MIKPIPYRNFCETKSRKTMPLVLWKGCANYYVVALQKKFLQPYIYLSLS